MKPVLSFSALLLFASLVACGSDSTKQQKALPSSKETTAGLQLPEGFTATIVAQNLGVARHIAVDKNGDIYVKLENLKDGKGIIRLRDTNNDGVADETFAFGNYGGTGIAVKDGYLYASSNTSVFRYKITDKYEISDPKKPEVLVKDLVDRRQHASKSITLDNNGYLYVNIGAPSNACQEVDRTKGSKGQDPCPILETAGGIWQFRTDQQNQSYPEGVRYATGLRNVVGLDWNTSVNALFVTQHGRDQLNSMYPELYNDTTNAELPAEEFFRVDKGMNFGWPYCYYDPFQKKKVLAPEYGGDGKTVGRCGDMEQPLLAFPAHWAPNALHFYTGNQFPEKYKNGAFIAFHGSWNRAPLPQGGYNVIFLPMKDGKPSGAYEIFADGFAGEDRTPSGAKHRPCGLAMGPDGSLYISDDQNGFIWKISYTGEK
jgi:glucose/arabinose dehydrogenase